MHELILNEAHYERVIAGVIPEAQKFLWIATADIKDVHVKGAGKRYVPFLKVLSDLVASGVDVRLIHAKEPGPRFRRDFDKFPELVENERFERILCPRMHMKLFIVDGRMAYIGSANLEAGVLTDDRGMIRELMEELDELYLGNHCIGCGRRDVCPDPIV